MSVKYERNFFDSFTIGAASLISISSMSFRLCFDGFVCLQDFICSSFSDVGDVIDLELLNCCVLYLAKMMI